MSRQARHDWALSIGRRYRRARTQRAAAEPSPFRRSLRFEPLENRRMLSITVDTLSDVVDANDGFTSLREAIATANVTPGADTIDFSPSLTTGVSAKILLTQGELAITEALTIDGPGADQLTIDAQQHSRLFDITASTGDFTISGLTVTAGKTTGSNADSTDTTFNGGAIRSVTDGTLVIDQASILANETDGNLAFGGGIYASGNLSVSNTDVTNNHTSGQDGIGGGLATMGQLTLIDSTVSGNKTTGSGSQGGGVFVYRDATVSGSTISNNNTMTYFSKGGGICAAHALTITDSTVTGNGTADQASSGGGISCLVGPVNLTNVTLTDNSTLGDTSQGGGIYGLGNVIAVNSTISGNSTAGYRAPGGAIVGSFISLTNSVLSNNRTQDAYGVGGAIHGFTVTLYNSIASSNSTVGDNSPGGSIWANSAVKLVDSSILTNSTNGKSAAGGAINTPLFTAIRSSISRNSTTGAGSDGGAVIATISDVENCTISANSTGGTDADGGGLFTGTLSLVNSTVSGNSTAGSTADGGGIYSSGKLTSVDSTIASNKALNANARGGGVFRLNPVPGGADVFTNSIIANNSAGGSSPDLRLSSGSIQLVRNVIGNGSGTSFVEAPLGSPDANGNLIGGPVRGAIDPLLGALAYNGGPVFLDGSKLLTRAPLAGSPAINAGDPSAVAGVGNVPVSDERGVPFTRVFGGRIDMGAVEVEPAGFLAGDYNGNGVVDAADYAMWRDESGSSVAAATGADGNGDGVVNPLDYDVWKTNFGLTPPVVPGAGSAAATMSATAGKSPVLIVGVAGISSEAVVEPNVAPPIQRLAAESPRDGALLLLVGTETNGGALPSDLSSHVRSAAADERGDNSIDAVDDVFASLAVSV